MRITPVLRTLIFGFGICVTEAAFIVSEGFEVVAALLSGAEGLLLLTLGLDQRGVERLVIREDVTGPGENFGVAAAKNKSCFPELG